MMLTLMGGDQQAMDYQSALLPATTLIGRRFGRLTVLRFLRSDNGRVWECRCDCGNLHMARSGHLNGGSVISCGCAQQGAGRITGQLHGHKHATHGMRNHPLYNVHRLMVKRCYNPKDQRFGDYGGRGITVCDTWRQDRRAFFNWALAHGYQPGLSIDRIDNDRGYSPENCRWITRAAQAGNSRKNRLLTWHNETLTVSAWARRLGVAPRALQHRVDRGWSIERIFTQAFRHGR